MTEILTGQVAAATKKCARKWAQEKCPFSVPAWGPIKIPDTQIFLPASQPQAHHKCYDCKLRLELQLNAITCTVLLWRARGLIRGGSIHFWGSGRIVVGGRNLVCTGFFSSTPLHTNIEAARREKSSCGKAEMGPSHYTYVLLRTEVHRIILRCASQFPHPHKSTFLMHSLGHLKRTLLILDLLLRRLEYSLSTERW